MDENVSVTEFLIWDGRGNPAPSAHEFNTSPLPRRTPSHTNQVNRTILLKRATVTPSPDKGRAGEGLGAATKTLPPFNPRCQGLIITHKSCGIPVLCRCMFSTHGALAQLSISKFPLERAEQRRGAGGSRARLSEGPQAPSLRARPAHRAAQGTGWHAPA